MKVRSPDFTLDPRVARLRSADECMAFVSNVKTTHPELAAAARRRSVELRAAQHGVRSDVEREAIEAIYAFEEARTLEAGKRVRASRTWQSIQRNGILATVERIVSRPHPTTAYETLIGAGLQEFTFEAVVLRYPECFAPATVSQARIRLQSVSP